MPADASEQIRQLPSGKWQLRYYDRKGVRHSGGAFPSKSAARAHYRDVIEPELNGRPVARRDLTYSGPRRRVPRAARDRREAEDDHRAPVAAQAVARRSSGRCRSPSSRGWPTRSPGSRSTLPERLPLPAHGGAAAGARGGRPLRLPDPQPGEARGPEPDARAAGDPGLHRRTSSTAIADELGTVRGGRGQVRGGDRTTARGVGVGRAEGRRQGSTGARWCAGRRRSARGARCRSPRRRSRRSSRCPRGSTAATCSRRRGSVPGSASRARSTSRTSVVASGGRRSTRPGSRSRRGSTTSGRRSPRTRSPAGITMFELARIMGTQREDDRAHYGTLIDTAHDAILTRIGDGATDSAGVASAHGYSTALSIVLKSEAGRGTSGSIRPL